MSPRMLSYGVAGLMVASALAAPAAVTKTVVDLVVETQVVHAGAVAPVVNAPAPAAAAPTANVAAQAAPAPAVKAEAAVPSSSSSDSTATGGKRGLLLDSSGALTPFLSVLSGGEFSWFANWVSADKGVSGPGLEFVPQLKTMFADVWNTEAGASIAAGSKYLLGLNEPDIPSQENMAVADAVTQWHDLMEPFADQAKLITPSVSNSQTPGMGLDWLSDFLAQCQGCSIHACGYHWHDTSADVDYFKDRVEAAHAACPDYPLWISEYSADTDEASQASFVAETTEWLDSLDYVERYAYFQASTMDSGATLNSVGAAYADTP